MKYGRTVSCFVENKKHGYVVNGMGWGAEQTQAERDWKKEGNTSEIDYAEVENVKGSR